MYDLTKLNEQYQEKVVEARSILESINDKTPDSEAKELEERHDKLLAEAEGIEEKVKRAQRAKEAEERINASRAPETSTTETGEGREETRSYRDMYVDYLRGGLSGLPESERSEFRAQATSPDTAGGHLVAREFFDELMVTMKDFGPMLDPGVSRQITTTTGATLDWPTLNDTANKGALLGENTQDTGSDLAFGAKVLDAYKYTSNIFRVSEELLQDSSIDVESIVREAMAERIGRIVNEHLTTGTGSNQPNGVLTAAASAFTTTSGTSFTANELIDLFHSIDPAYRRSPQFAFMFNDTTLREIRKLTDGQGNYLWQEPDLRVQQPALFMGKPYAINQDMPDVAVNNTPIVLGDMSRYVVRRVREFAVRRLVERYADFYQIGFVGFGRFDGELVDSAAVKKLTMAAT